jgi:FG-GAP repeat
LDSGTGTRSEDLKLTASDRAGGDIFGTSVSLSGNAGLVGARGKGAAYLFRSLDSGSGTRTENLKLTASDGEFSDSFGQSVNLDGDRFMIGSRGGNGIVPDSGTAYSGNVRSFTTMNAGNVSQTISKLSFVSQDDWIIGQTTSGN